MLNFKSNICVKAINRFILLEKCCKLHTFAQRCSII